MSPNGFFRELYAYENFELVCLHLKCKHQRPFDLPASTSHPTSLQHQITYRTIRISSKIYLSCFTPGWKKLSVCLHSDVCNPYRPYRIRLCITVKIGCISRKLCLFEDLIVKTWLLRLPKPQRGRPTHRYCNLTRPQKG